MSQSRKVSYAAALVAIFLVAGGSIASAPAGHYAIGTGAATGTVLDKKSGLTWQRDFSSSRVLAPAALSYCSGLALNGSGWRVPTERELYSLVDHSLAAAPYIDLDTFPGTPSALFASATVSPFTGNGNWHVDFSNCNTGADTTAKWVRCVR